MPTRPLQKRVVLILGLAVLAVAVLGCAPREQPPGAVAKIGVRGTITQVETAGLAARGNLGAILVEGEQDPDIQTDRAFVTITGTTRIARGERRLSFEDLEQGQRVEVDFVGPVRESYPVQADAGAVRIID